MTAPQMTPKACDWEEDANLENGHYSCQCHKCAEIFVGYKRRTLCRVCAGPIPGDVYLYAGSGNLYVVTENPVQVKVDGVWQEYIAYRRISGMAARQMIAPTYNKTRKEFMGGFTLIERNAVDLRRR
jgi:hypothetical protein